MLVEVITKALNAIPHIGDEGEAGHLGTVYKTNNAFLNELIRSSRPPVYRDPRTGAETHKGNLVGGIPYTTPARDKPSITLRNPRTGEQASSDNANHVFSQQSISKTVAHGQAIELAGSEPAFRKFVGTEASGEPYNSHKTLPDGRAPNPHVNIGAISTQLVSHMLADKNSLVGYKDLLRRATGNTSLDFKDAMANGEWNEGPGQGGISNNRRMLENMVVPSGLIHKLLPSGTHLTSDERKMAGEAAFLKYCYACSGQVTTKDLAAMAGMFANKGVRVDPDGTRERVFGAKTADAVSRTNVVSGSYDEAGLRYVKAHTSVKTGVEGGIMGTVETADGHRVAVGAYHPDLNATGNSGAGQKYLHSFSEKRIAFPSEEAAYRAAGEEVREARPGEFGESPYDMNERLMGSAEPGIADMLRAVSLDLQPENGGAFYVKDAATHDAKHKPNTDETPILGVQNQNGNRINYSFVNANHTLSKIRARIEEPPALTDKAAMPGAWPDNE